VHDDEDEVKRLFVVMLHRGAAHDSSKPLEGQIEWEAHRKFINGLEKEGLIVLGGPLEGTSEVLLIWRAVDQEEIVRRWSEDPWAKLDLLRLSRVVPWELRIGSV